MTDLPDEPSAAPIPDGAPEGGNAGRSPLSDGAWHRLHPLTPLFRGGLVLVIAAGIVIANFRERAIEWVFPLFAPDAEFDEAPPDPLDFVLAHDLLLVVVVGLVVVSAVLVGLFRLSWQFHTFRITEDDVEVRSGVLFRTQRRAPLDRVQGVNLIRPMAARLAGLAKLEIVGAGSDTNVRLEYLSTTNAEAVRADILRLASGRRLGTSGGLDPRRTSRTAAAASAVGSGVTGLVAGVDTGDVAPESVISIPVGRLIASRILSGTTLVLLVVLVAIIVGASVGSPWVLFAFVPALLGFVAYWVRGLTRALRYSVAPTADGVRLTFGFFTTTTEILPPGRVHAVQVSQSLLWRPFGWWSVSVNRLSGRGATETRADTLLPVLPVGDRADVERMLRLILPTLREEEWEGVVGPGIRRPITGDPFVNTPRRARWLRPLSWRRNGFVLTRDALFFRRGALWRKLVILPLARLQSLQISQGPIDRAADVASIRAHTVTGPVDGGLGIVDRRAAVALFAAGEEAALAAASADRTHRWAGEETP